MSIGKLVLVTGISGFVGSATALTFLEKGWNVRGAVRRQEQATAWEEKYPQYKGQLSWVFVKDLADDGAFDEAVIGVDAIAHTASPFTFTYNDAEKDLLIPAKKGTTSILHAALKEPKIKVVGITSSFAAIHAPGPAGGPEHHYTAEVWPNYVYEEVVKSPIPAIPYLASKTFAEKAVWEFVETEKPHFSVTTICPPLILGASLQPLSSNSALGFSASFIWNIVDAAVIPPTQVAIYINVRDVALAHYLCVVDPVAAGKRYFLVGGDLDWIEVANILREEFPEQAHRIPAAETGTPVPPRFTYDASPIQKELGIKPIDLRQTIIEAGRQLFDTEKASQK